MIGEHEVVVQSRKLKYEFTIRRNITILRGDSATGKTTLLDMILAYNRNPKSGVSLSCDKDCVVFDVGAYVKEREEALFGIRDSIVFIDEGQEFVCSKKFASIVKNTDNYYVIVTREPLPQLPYSISEIYGIRESSKYGGLRQKYNEMYSLYKPRKSNSEQGNIDVDIIITEDSNSGFEFFKAYCDRVGIKCVAAGGKSNVSKEIELHKEAGNLLAIVDGAAFGSEMGSTMDLVAKGYAKLYAPESFEWLLLRSGVIREVPKDKLENPSNYIESSRYFSWEQYFTELIADITERTPYKYGKSHINKAYLQESNMQKIIESIGFLETPKE